MFVMMIYYHGNTINDVLRQVGPVVLEGTRHLLSFGGFGFLGMRSIIMVRQSSLESLPSPNSPSRDSQRPADASYQHPPRAWKHVQKGEISACEIISKTRSFHYYSVLFSKLFLLERNQMNFKFRDFPSGNTRGNQMNVRRVVTE